MKIEAQKGLDWREEFGRGGTRVGAVRARQIVAGENLSDDTVKRMYSFFSRHEVDKQAEGFSEGEDGYPSNGRIAWALWGGDAGFSWSRRLVEQMKNEKSFDSQESEKHPLSTKNKEEKSMENKENRHILNVTETDNTVIVEFEKHEDVEQEGEAVEMEATDSERPYHDEEEDRKVVDMPMKYRTIDLTKSEYIDEENRRVRVGVSSE